MAAPVPSEAAPAAPAAPDAPAASRRRKPARRLRSDESAVSEMVGQILAFGIVSMVFVLSMIAFRAAEERTTDRVAEMRAESTATRVASMLVQTGLLAESQGTTVRASLRLDLPEDIEGDAYRVELRLDAARTAIVAVTIPARSIEAEAPLLAVEAPASIEVCSSDVAGGPLYVRYADPGTGTACLHLSVTQ